MWCRAKLRRWGRRQWALVLILNICGHHPHSCTPTSHNFTARLEYPEDGPSACAKPQPPSSMRDPCITPTTPPAPSAISSTTPLYAARAKCPRCRQCESITPPRACSDSPDATSADNTPFTAPPRSKSRMFAPHRIVHFACIVQNVRICGYNVPMTPLARQRRTAASASSGTRACTRIQH